MSGTREENVFMAGLAEQAERYEDMAEYMKRVAMIGGELSSEERNLLSAAYKGCVGARRQSWRALATLDVASDISTLIKNYRVVIENELNEKCGEILKLLSTHLLPNTADAEAKVFFMKMQGDYHRYIVELTPPDQRAGLAQQAHDSYQGAMAIAEQSLPCANALRLGLALNLAVFYNEVFGAADKACALAKKTLDEAMPLLDENRPEDQEGVGILALLRDNYGLWTSAMHPDGTKPLEQDGTTMEDL